MAHTAYTIRAETPQDYAQIAEVNTRAFDNRASEAVIVALHRHRRAFDPDLSLVAVADARVIGHVLFSPQSVRLMGEQAQAVNLAPIAVDPDFQSRGIGVALIAEGHVIARTKGYTLSFLLRHPTYYPRFGYRTHVYGNSAVRAVIRAEPAPGTFEMRPPSPADLSELHALWLHVEGAADFAIDPGPEWLAWVSPNPAIEALVYARNGAVVGFTRVHSAALLAPRVFLAADAAAARAMAADIAWRGGTRGEAEVTLPLHPNSTGADIFGAPHCEAWAAGMACGLAPGPFEAFYSQLQDGQRGPGRVIWPVSFDLD